MLFKLHIRKHERGLVFKDGEFVTFLPPGDHIRPGWLGLSARVRVEVVNTLDTRFVHKLLDMLAKEDSLQGDLEFVSLGEHQRAIVWKDDRLMSMVGPGLHAFWKSPYKLDIEVYDIDEFEFKHDRLDVVWKNPTAQIFLDSYFVSPNHKAILFRDGNEPRELGPGRFVFWKDAGHAQFVSVDLRERVADIAGQDIMTADKVTLRVNMVVSYVVTNAVLAVTAVADHAQALYREAQLALRAAVGARNLDQLLADKDAVGDELALALAKRAMQLGIELKSCGLRDVILPGDMKTILNQVIEAEKQAQANLIRRREETAAARSQANTAKLLAENPTLARMKEMEALADMLKGTRSTFVFGNGNVTEQLKSLMSGDQGEDNP